MFGFEASVLVPMMIFVIPIIAIIGGITAGIVRTLGQQRLIELAQRERIAAIERGVDPAKLPPIPSPGLGDDLASMYVSPAAWARRRAMNLTIGGLVTLAAGIGLGVMLLVLPDGEDAHRAWTVGLIPGLIGVALLISAAIVRRSEHDDRPPARG